MAEKPILFNTPMVKAILDGRKTQTRRLIKPHLTKNEAGWRVCISADGVPYGVETYDDDERSYGYIPPPYDYGDVLWVRETWADIPETSPGNLHYRASATDADLAWFREMGWKWRPSIHMPREAARLFLRVTNVRIERLQDMSAEDCANDGGFAPEAVSNVGIEALFKPLWDSTIGKDDLPRYGWEANRWVWVIEFERIDRKGRFA